MVSVSLALGLTNKFSLASSLPIIINRNKNKSLDQTDTEFGDLSVTGRAFFSPRIFSKPANIQVTIGASFPFGGGITNIMTDERNFASGTIDPIGSFVIALGITPDWNVTTKFFTRKIISTASDDQRTGDQYRYGVEAVYAPLGRSYSANAGFLIVNRGADIINGIPFVNSGGDWTYARIGGSIDLIATGESAIRLWSEVQLPVYIDVNGIQLAEKWNLRFGLTTGLSLFGHDENKKSFEPFYLPTDSQ